MGLLQKVLALMKEQTAEEIRRKITGYCQTHADFQGILLKTPAEPEQVSAMVGALGLVVVLPSARLILLPQSLDRELIAHRLSSSLNAEILVSFAADTPDKALELIQPGL